jgi:hypothetical protein
VAFSGVCLKNEGKHRTASLDDRSLDQDLKPEPSVEGMCRKDKTKPPSYKFKIVANIILGVLILGKLSFTSTFWSS